MDRYVKSWAVTVLAFASVAAFTASGAAGEPVKLTVKGGGLEVEGELISFDGSKYVLNSATYGEITVDAARFDCVKNCPQVGGSQPSATAVLAPAQSGTTPEISMAGSNTIGNALMPALIEGYAEAQGLQATRVVGQSTDPLDLAFKLADKSGKDVALIKLRRHGSGTSFEELEKGTAEIGMSSRRIKDKEVKALAAKGLGDMLAPTHEHVLGLDGLVVIVAQNSPVKSLTMDQITKIFAGQITDWSEVGLPKAPIQVYAPEDRNGTFATFEDLVLKPAKVTISAKAKRNENHAEQSDWVSADPLGIGFVGIAYQRNNRAIEIETSCGLKTKPTRFSMKTEEYPLSRRLYLYTAGQPKSQLANGILQFALSDKAQPIVTATDFIDQAPELLPFKDNSARVSYALAPSGEDFNAADMKALVATIQNGERLSSTLRFETAKFTLDTKAVKDIGRIARILAEPEYKSRKVTIIGFADGVGSYASNKRLSLQRASAVEAALKSAGYTGATKKGFGELAPVACNDTDAARELNRRVEVWLE